MAMNQLVSLAALPAPQMATSLTPTPMARTPAKAGSQARLPQANFAWSIYAVVKSGFAKPRRSRILGSPVCPAGIFLPSSLSWISVPA